MEKRNVIDVTLDQVKKLLPDAYAFLLIVEKECPDASPKEKCTYYLAHSSSPFVDIPGHPKMDLHMEDPADEYKNCALIWDGEMFG